MSTPADLLDILQAEVAGAAERIQGGAERGLALMNAEAVDRDALSAVFMELLEASSFGDLIGQRLDQLRSTITGTIDGRADAHLLNGPARPGQTLDQADIDALLAD